MKHWLSHTLALIGVGLATFAVTPTHAQITAPGPYYATPSWDQQLPAATRFIVLSNWNNDAVLDRETGLVWERAPDRTRYQWHAAHFHCINSVLGGRRAWRLPTLQELASLVDPTVGDPGPFLPPGHPFTNLSGFEYWSATSNADNPSSAYTVTFRLGGLTAGWSKTNDWVVWCVRGGQGVDLQ